MMEHWGTFTWESLHLNPRENFKWNNKIVPKILAELHQVICVVDKNEQELLQVSYLQD